MVIAVLENLTHVAKQKTDAVSQPTKRQAQRCGIPSSTRGQSRLAKEWGDRTLQHLEIAAHGSEEMNGLETMYNGTFKHVLDEDTALSDSFLDAELLVIRGDEENWHV
jgi:hypothetical protein